MITKVGISLDKNHGNIYGKSNLTHPNRMNFVNLQGTDYITFTGSKGNKEKKEKLEDVMYRAETPTKEILEQLKQEAKEAGFNEVTPFHAIRHELVELDKCIDELNSGKRDLSANNLPYIIYTIQGYTTDGILANPVWREKTQTIAKKYIAKIDEMLEPMKPEKADPEKPVALSENLVDLLWGYDDATDLDVTSGTIIPSAIIDSIFDNNDKRLNKFTEDLLDEFRDALYIRDVSDGERFSFPVYEEKVDNILKNLSLGTNMFVTFDPAKTNPKYFIDTIQKTLSQKNNENPDKKPVKVVEFNGLTTSYYFNNQIEKYGKDKTSDYIVIADLGSMLNSKKEDSMEFSFGTVDTGIIKATTNQPSNVKYIFYGPEQAYYSVTDSSSSYIFDNVQDIGIPTLSTSQMIKSFEKNPKLMKEIQKPFSKPALEKAIEASSQMDGVFPKKSLDLMKKIVRYNVDKDKIEENDVINYLKEATHLFKKANEDSSVTVIFDTGKKLKSMVGKHSTQKEAAAIVKQIKSRKMGTKGVVIYSQDGSPGGGRRYTAKAIAGEARVPYVEVNAVDFGAKDVDIFGGGELSPEASMKKLFSLVRSQAEANPNKSAVLFVENFEYFSVGELVSVYHQKAMAQLLREMEKADAAGLNILVAGSVSDPKMIGEAMLKSFKFVDKLEVSSPAIDKDSRAEVIRHTLKENKVKIENDELIDYAASIAHRFPFIQLKNLVKKSQSIALERGHKVINKSDITEAYLQITLGRANLVKNSEHDNRITALHECGHAVNLEVMRNVSKTLGKPWHNAGQVSFITLDPRGYYGGAVYGNNDENETGTFESVFGDIVMSFGGCSAENLFCGIQGSVGIGMDMQMARQSAEYMVTCMGLGAKTGHMAIYANDDISDEMKRIIEQDERVILNNAKLLSDYITEVYADFNEWFTEKYSKLVGTGDCLIPGDEFRKAFEMWKSQQSPEKQEQLKDCDETIMKVIDATKKGLMVRKYD